MGNRIEFAWFSRTRMPWMARVEGCRADLSNKIPPLKLSMKGTHVYQLGGWPQTAAQRRMVCELLTSPTLALRRLGRAWPYTFGMFCQRVASDGTSLSISL